MIIEKLNRIIFDIRLLEKQYEMPTYMNFENDLTARSICDKQIREERIAAILFQIVKEYALSTKDSHEAINSIL